ncbi:MTBP protein, partial [Amia calva]|nr:MTBP protein [Amia calva]
LIEEAAEGLHQLSDKLPPPGKALLDVIILAEDKAPSLKELLLVLGSLKHMQAWHSAKITIVTEDATGWQKAAAYLSAHICSQDNLECCFDGKEIWRGSVLIREKKFASEVRFGGFCLKEVPSNVWGSGWSSGSGTPTVNKLHTEVFQYYKPVLDLLQVVALSDLPIYFQSSADFELGVLTKPGKGKSQLLLDQLDTLRDTVGALFALSCTVSSVAVPPASQLSTQKWKENLAKKSKSLTAPAVEMKGESGQYFLLVQGTDSGSCRARLIHSANQMNGAAALATVNGMLSGTSMPGAGSDVAGLLRSVPCLRGAQLIHRGRREESNNPASVPVRDLKVLLTLAREQYLKMYDDSLPRTLLHDKKLKENRLQTPPGSDSRHTKCTETPERSVLQNFENQEKNRQKMRMGIMLSGSSESLLGPKEGQRLPSTQLDAKELLKYFTPEGLPTGELQPLQIQRGENAFQLSPDLTPRKVQKLPFNKAANSHYHGIEFCLDDRKALDRDKGFVKLQSRLIRYETHTTCSKETCPVPFTLSPAPSPAVLSEPGSVPDGEAWQLEQKGELGRQKRRSREADGTYPHKRLAKSESSDSLLLQSSGSSGHHPAVRALREQPHRSRSTSLAPLRHNPTARIGQPTEGKTQGQERMPTTTESRSQKHARMLKEVVAKTLKHHEITKDHACFEACSQRLFEISKFYLKDLKTSRGLQDEMKKAAGSNAKQV